jgi:hypothetical protein
MLHAILIFGAVATAGAICFFDLFFRFMRGDREAVPSSGRK